MRRTISTKPAVYGLLATTILLSVGAVPSVAQPSSGAEVPEGKPSAEEAEAKPSAEPLDDGSVLPWNRPTDDEIKPPARRLSSPREMLELFGIDASQIDHLVDDRPLDPDEEETLVKILYRIPFFGREKIDAWCRGDLDCSKLAEDSATHRLQMLRLRGRAKGLEQVELPSETASRLEFAHYYRVRFEVEGSPYPVVACSRSVPAAWEQRDTLDERASLLGLFLKTGPADGEHPELVFATERVAWHPDREEPEVGIAADHVLLGDLGMDVGLFDDLRHTNRRGLVAEDSECFYHLLAAVREADASELFRRARGGFDAEAMLTRPETQHGHLVTLTGTARRVQKIVVGEEDILQRFGIDHYYQVDIFVPLGDQEIRLGQGGDADEVPVFRNRFPVTCCVLDLPADLPARDDVSMQVRAAGFYFKLWAFKTEYVSSFDQKQRQIGPLFVATVPQVVPTSRLTSPLWGWIGGSAFLLALAALALVAWLFRRSDRRFEQSVLRRRRESGQ
jgi:hypothetical protein